MLVDGSAVGYREIAAELHMPIGSIGPTRARAFDRLRRELESDGQLSLMVRGGRQR